MKRRVPLSKHSKFAQTPEQILIDKEEGVVRQATAGHIPGVTDKPTRDFQLMVAARNNANANKSRNTKVAFNLRAVSEALVDEGFDPAKRLIDVLKKGELEADIEARLLMQLLEFTQPKLKAVEVKIDPLATVTEEQMNARIQALLSKAKKKGSM